MLTQMRFIKITQWNRLVQFCSMIIPSSTCVKYHQCRLRAGNSEQRAVSSSTRITRMRRIFADSFKKSVTISSISVVSVPKNVENRSLGTCSGKIFVSRIPIPSRCTMTKACCNMLKTPCNTIKSRCHNNQRISIRSKCLI